MKTLFVFILICLYAFNAICADKTPIYAPTDTLKWELEMIIYFFPAELWSKSEKEKQEWLAQKTRDAVIMPARVSRADPSKSTIAKTIHVEKPGAHYWKFFGVSQVLSENMSMISGSITGYTGNASFILKLPTKGIIDGKKLEMNGRYKVVDTKTVTMSNNSMRTFFVIEEIKNTDQESVK